MNKYGLMEYCSEPHCTVVAETGDRYHSSEPTLFQCSICMRMFHLKCLWVPPSDATENHAYCHGCSTGEQKNTCYCSARGAEPAKKKLF